MGMFDTVNFEMDCPKCGTKVNGFQSKDSVCDLKLVDPDAVNSFYSSCGKCRNWIEVNRYETMAPSEPRDTPFSLDEVEALGFRVTRGASEDI